MLKANSEDMWQQGDSVTVTITDLDDQGNGVGRVDQRIVFIPDTVPGDRITAQLLYVKPSYAHGKVKQLLSASADRVRPACIVADKCGGCQWQHVDYPVQLAAKQNQIIQALQRIGGFTDMRVDPVLAATAPLHYRNKATYPLGQRNQTVTAGYYQKRSHRLINLNQCPVQDERLNPLLAEVKHDIQQRGWAIYNETQHQGQLRHLSLRIGRRTGDMLLTLVSTSPDLPDLVEQAEAWMQRYPGLVGVCMNENPNRTNAIFGQQTTCLAGQGYIQENFAGLTFQIQANTFFQVNTEQAEALFAAILAELALTGQETLVDAYCGIGTFTLPLARQVRQAIGLEVQADAVEQARLNAQLNDISNVDFHGGDVARVLPTLTVTPDIVLLDPPRKGCDPAVLDWIQTVQPQRLVYVSCKPATLARDLKRLCSDGLYHLDRVQPADFFPQTAHVECAAFLTRTTPVHGDISQMVSPDSDGLQA